MLTLRAGELHIWLCYSDRYQPDSETNAEVLRGDELDEQERARMQRFKFKRHAEHFCLSHTMVRQVLSQYADIAPPDWHFSANEFGKPFITNPGQQDLYYSLSHTRGLIMVAVARGAEIGCDVEWHSARVRCAAIAHRYFSAAEERELKRLQGAALRQRFFDFWALKESYIKAKGRGLAIGLGKFGFSLEQRPIGFFADEELQERPACWSFSLVDVGTEHSGAYAFPAPVCRASMWQYSPGVSPEFTSL